MRESERTAATSAIVTKLAKLIGRFLATKTPANIRRWLEHPQELLGIKISSEDLGIFGAGVLGMTVEQALRYLFPKIGTDVGKWINIAAAAIMNEYVGATMNNAVVDKKPRPAETTSTGNRRAEDSDDEPANKSIFTDFLAQAMHSKNPDLANMAWRLFGIIRQNRLSAPEFSRIEACNSIEKFVLLASCRSIEEVRNILPLMDSQINDGALTAAIHGIQSVLNGLGGAVRTMRENSRAKAAELDANTEALRLCQESGVRPRAVFLEIGEQVGITGTNQLRPEHVRMYLQQEAMASPSEDSRSGGSTPNHQRTMPANLSRPRGRGKR